MATIKVVSRISAPIVVAVTTFSIFLSCEAFGQSSGKTVRHHTVMEQDPNAAILTEAESDIARDDFVAAKPLLKKYLETYPDSYAAWYDLGYLYRALGKNEASIAAFKRSVASKPDVFESNLNLGVAL